MKNIASATDNRIIELLKLSLEERLPLALSPQTICALEDSGYLVDPFTAQLWHNPETLGDEDMDADSDINEVDDARLVLGLEFLRELADIQISAIEATIAAAAAQIAVLEKKLADALSSHAAACNELDTLRIQLMQLDADNAALISKLQQKEVQA